MTRPILYLAAAFAPLLPLAARAEPFAPVETVRACPSHGPGFYAIPGTTTCIRIGGRVRSEFTVASRRATRDDAGGFRTGGRVSIDARTDTAYGPLRSFVRLKVDSLTGRER